MKQLLKGAKAADPEKKNFFAAEQNPEFNADSTLYRASGVHCTPWGGAQAHLGKTHWLACGAWKLIMLCEAG